MGIAKLNGKSAKNYYYEKDSFFSSEVAGMQNLNIKGQTAGILGIFGKEADKATFQELLDGFHGDTELRNHKQQQTGNERVGYDITFSAPKSVSHASLVLDQKDVVEAHKIAVEIAMKELEKSAGALVWKDGERVVEKTGNILYADATHSVSRSAGDSLPDPSLHTHNIIFNTTHTEKGFRALEAEKIFKRQNELQSIYKSALAHELKKAGYDLEFDKRGNFEIKGYDEATLKNFSKRSEEIAGQAEAMKQEEKYKDSSMSNLKSFAQHNFKQAKVSYTKEELTKEWDRQHKELNIQDKEELLKNIENQKATKEERQNTSQFKNIDEVIELASTNLISKKAHVTISELKREVIRANNGDFDVRELIKKIEDIPTTGQVNDHDLKKIIVDGEERITNKKIFDTTERVSKMLLDLSNKKIEALATKEQANFHLDAFEKKKGWKLSETQREAVFNLLTTTDSISATIGDAGTGKTAMLEGLNYVYSTYYGDDKAFNDLGVLAPTGKAASGAKADSGIKSATVDSFLLNGGFQKETPAEIFKNKVKEFNFDKENPHVYEKSRNLHSDPKLNSFKNEKIVKIREGKFKGATQTIITDRKGDAFHYNATIEFNESKLITDIKSNKLIPFVADSKAFRNFSSDNKILNTNEEKRFFGFKSTVKKESYLLNGEFVELKGETSITFLGQEIRRTSFEADKKGIVQSISNFGKDPVITVKEANQKLEQIDRELDKQEASLKDIKPRMIIIDETSMLDIEKTEKLIAYALEHNIKLSFIGDNKQLLSVGAGKAFDDILKFTHNNRMNQANRQKTAETKDVVDTFAKGEAREAMKKLNDYGKIKTGTTEENINKITDILSSKNEKGEFNYKNTLALASTRKEIEAINSKTREKLFGSADAGIKHKVMIGTGMDSIEHSKIENYKKGQLLLVKGDDNRTTVYKIKDINKDKTLSLESVPFSKGDIKTNKTLTPRTEWKKIATSYDVKELAFEVGDKVMNFQNNKRKDIMNGDIGFVTKVSKKSMTIDFGNNKIVEFKIDKDKPLNLGHAYGMTIHKSQGVTADKVLALLDSTSNMINKNLGYVAISREKFDLTVFTDNIKELFNKLDKAQEQASVSDSNEQKTTLYKDYVEKDVYLDKKFKDVIISEYEDLKRQSSELYKDYKAVMKDIEKIEKSIKDSLFDNKDEKEIAYYKDKLEHLEKIKNDVENRMNNKVDIKDHLEKTNSKIDDISKKEEKIVNELNDKIDNFKKEIKSFENKNEKLSNDLEEKKNLAVDKYATSDEKDKYTKIKDEIKSNSSKIDLYKKELEATTENKKITPESRENLTSIIKDRISKLEEKNDALVKDKEKIETSSLRKTDKVETEQLKDLVSNIEKNDKKIDILKNELKEEVINSNRELNELTKQKEVIEKDFGKELNDVKKNINSSKKDFEDLKRDMRKGFKDELVEDQSNKVQETLKEEIKRLATSKVDRLEKHDLKDNSKEDDKSMVRNVDDNIASRNGFSPEALDKWKTHALSKATTDDDKEKIEKFVVVSNERAEVLKDIAILDKNGKFTDDRAKEIFEKNKGGDLEHMATLSRDSYKEAINEKIEKLTDQAQEQSARGEHMKSDKTKAEIERLEKILTPEVVEKEKELSQAYKDVKLKDDKFETKSENKSNDKELKTDKVETVNQTEDKSQKVDIKENIKTNDKEELKTNSKTETTEKVETKSEDKLEKTDKVETNKANDKEQTIETDKKVDNKSIEKEEIKSNSSKIEIYKKELETIENKKITPESRENLTALIKDRISKLEERNDALRNDKDEIKSNDKLEINDKKVDTKEIPADKIEKAELKDFGEYKNNFKDEIKTIDKIENKTETTEKVEDKKIEKDFGEYKNDFKDEIKSNDKEDKSQKVDINENVKSNDKIETNDKLETKSNDKIENKTESAEKVDNNKEKRESSIEDEENKKRTFSR